MPQKKTRKKKLAKKSTRDPKFIGLAIAAALSLVVIAVAGWLVYDSQRQSKEPASSACTVSDEELCKFFAISGPRDAYKATVTTTDRKGKTTIVYYYTNGDKRSRYLIKDGKTTFNYTIIDKIIYMMGADGTIWKQVLTPDKLEEYSRGYDFRFKTPNSSVEDARQLTYKMYSTEWYTYPYQLKYQVTDANSPNDTSFIWFDTEEYLLRRYSRQNSEGTMEVTFSYEDISIDEPQEKVKILGPNEYILPGKSKPEVVTTKN